MPLPRSRLGFDFFLSLVQPVFFGFSLSFPACFPVLLGALLLAVSIRQYTGHKELSKSLFNRICQRQPPIDYRANGKEDAFRKSFAKLLKQRDYEALSGWRPVNIMVVIFSIVILIVGLVVWYLTSGVLPKDLWLRQGWHLPENWLRAHLLITAQSVLVSGCLVWRGHKILLNRAAFLYARKSSLVPGEKETNEMDEQFQQLLAVLDEKCK